MHLLTINDVNGIVHVFDKHLVRVACRMYADEWLGLRGSVAFLSAVLPFAVFALVAVYGVHAFP